MGTPGDIAHAVSFFASEAAGFITGQRIVVDGGLDVTVTFEQAKPDSAPPKRGESSKPHRHAWALGAS
jgi:hypothetical protein